MINSDRTQINNDESYSTLGPNRPPLKLGLLISGVIIVPARPSAISDYSRSSIRDVV